MGELDDVLALAWDGDGPAVASGARARASASVGQGWAVGAAVNGGVLMALGVHALGEGLAAAGHPDVLTWSALFVSATRPGPVEVHTEVLRSGRSLSSGQARLLQVEGDGPLERVRLTAAFGDATSALEPAHRAPGPPEMPEPGGCAPARRDGSEVAAGIALLDRLDVRVDPSTAGFALGRPSGRGVLRAWVAMADERAPDMAMLPFVVDCLMPVAFDLGVTGWAPTIELTGQVLGRPAPGWLQVQLSTDTVAGGFYVEDAEVWDSSGRLVARSRQLAGIRVPSRGLAPAPG